MEHNRDLMYVARSSVGGAVYHEREIETLHQILSAVETLHHLSVCTEIIDVNTFSVITPFKKVYQILRGDRLKPFQFICSKN
jgi:hypothetical protein